MEEDFDTELDGPVKEPFISICNKFLAALFVIAFIILTAAVCAAAFYFTYSRGLIERVTSLNPPQGFNVSVLVRFPNPTQLAVSPKTGNIFSGTETQGGIFWVNATGDGKAKKIISGLRNPTGIAFHGTSLYVAERGRILEYKNIEDDIDNPPAPEVTTTAFQSGVSLNQNRYMKIYNGRIYVMIGSPCNACLEPENTFGLLKSFKLDGSDEKIEHEGIRSSFGFDWNPLNGDFYFTDQGRSWSDDFVAKDELNFVAANDSKRYHFGFPYCYGNGTIDTSFNKNGTCARFRGAHVELDNQVGASGMTFYKGNTFNTTYRNSVFIAENGIWSGSLKTGYRITRVNVKTKEYSVFMDGWKIPGWQLGEIAWGKPSDVINYKNDLLIADSLYGAIFRIYSLK